MERAIMEQYKHMFNCKPENLPKVAEKASKDDSIDNLVVSAVSTLIGTSNPNKKDLEESGIYVPLRDFLKKLDSASLRRKCGDLPEVSVYSIKLETEIDESYKAVESDTL